MHLAKHQLHLAYCTNIHPAESWFGTLQALETYTLEVKRRLIEHGALSPGDPYAIGLRLGERAAHELLNGQLDSFQRWLDRHHCYVFTINGFPYGKFHGTRVKEQVYRPDWTQPERLSYTRALFKILATLASPQTGASVSTLPGSFKAFQADVPSMVTHLRKLANELDDLSDQTGIDFHLGLEPEPLGHFENSAETLIFFDQLLDGATDPQKIKRRIGINYDTCHFALQFETPESSIKAFLNEGLRLSKIHASSALALNPQNPAAREALHAFDEPTYLHQVIAQHPNGTLQRFADLPDAFLPQHLPEACQAEEWRVHFHIPLFAKPEPPLHSTNSFLKNICKLTLEGQIPCQHWEIETYTWRALPPHLQRPVVEQLCEEYHWLLSHLQ